MPNPRYANIDNDIDDEDEDWYDANGNPTPGGCYDAGGHINGERYASYMDDLRDQIRDRE
jgi:hypothetical protein